MPEIPTTVTYEGPLGRVTLVFLPGVLRVEMEARDGLQVLPGRAARREEKVFELKAGS